MRVRLAACGMRAISNLVDVTNYVMLETGHPLHAFDLDKLRGGIQIRRANARRAHDDAGRRRSPAAGERHRDRRRPRRDRAGRRDGRRGQRGLGDHDGASCWRRRRSIRAPSGAREAAGAAQRGVASLRTRRRRRTASRTPAARAADMLARAGGGAVAGEGVDRYPQQTETRRVSLSLAGLARLAGFEIPLAQAAEKLAAIGIASDARRRRAADGDGPQLSPRHLDRGGSRRGGHAHGRLRPRARPAAALQRRAGAEPAGASPIARAISWPRWGWPRSSAGASSRAGWLAPLGAPLSEGVVVKNPISADYEVMRTSLLPGLLDAARRNVARGVPDVGLFEVGPVVSARGRRQGRRRRAELRGRDPGRPARRLAEAGRAARFLRRQARRRRALARPRCRVAAVRAACAAALLHPGAGADDSRRRAAMPPIGQRRRGSPARRARAGPGGAGRSTSR